MNLTNMMLMEKLMFNQQPVTKSDNIPLIIILALIGAIFGLGIWLIKRQIERNDTNNMNNFNEVKADVKLISASLQSLQLEIAKEYLVTSRFVSYESENKRSIERIHSRIDEIQGAPPRKREE